MCVHVLIRVNGSYAKSHRVHFSINLNLFLQVLISLVFRKRANQLL